MRLYLYEPCGNVITPPLEAQYEWLRCHCASSKRRPLPRRTHRYGRRICSCLRPPRQRLSQPSPRYSLSSSREECTCAAGFTGAQFLHGELVSFSAWSPRGSRWFRPLRHWDSRMLTAHMIQHLLLMTITPPLIWLGEPLLTARPTRWPVPTRLGNLLTHSAFCWLTALRHWSHGMCPRYSG